MARTSPDSADDRMLEHIEETLNGIGTRLRRLRTERGWSLAEVAAAIGTSPSTLSRLESGKRRPTLELMLALARVYSLSLDELVGAPELADPRSHLRASHRNGRIVIPLTANPGGVLAWKVVLPAGLTPDRLRSHPGSEWLSVLSGTVRLLVGGSDTTLREGHTVEFDTRIPHWFGAAGNTPAEVLSILRRR